MKSLMTILFTGLVAIAPSALGCNSNENCEREVRYPCPTLTNPGRKCSRTVNDPTCLARRAACTVSVPQPRLPSPEQLAHISDNVSERRREITHRFNSVIWSKHFDYNEYLKFTSAVAASVATENPAPVKLYLENLYLEMKQQLIRNAQAEGREIARRLTMRLFIQAVNAAVNGGPMPRLSLNHVRIVPAKVMYDHWKDVTFRVPHFHGTTIRWTETRNRTDLPKTFQLYIGIDY